MMIGAVRDARPQRKRMTHTRAAGTHTRTHMRNTHNKRTLKCAPRTPATARPFLAGQFFFVHFFRCCPGGCLPIWTPQSVFLPAGCHTPPREKENAFHTPPAVEKCCLLPVCIISPK